MPIGEDEEEARTEMQRVLVVGLLDGGQNSVVLQLFPSAIARIMVAVEWAKSHPEVAHVEIVLHGEKPDALVMTLPRTALLELVADMTQQQVGTWQ